VSDDIQKIVVRFNGNWTKYYPGDVAGFEPHVAKKLEGMLTVDNKGNKRPLVTRTGILDRAGAFLERAGVVKGGGPKTTEPVKMSKDPEASEEKTVEDEGLISKVSKRGKRK